MASNLDYDQLVALGDVDLIPNVEAFVCPACLGIVQPQQGVVLRDCLHSFCRDCLSQSVASCEEAVVNCPFKTADYSCGGCLLQREIKALVSPALFEKYLHRSTGFHCKSPDCPGWCTLEDNVTIFTCPVCGKDNCLACDAFHLAGEICPLYQGELLKDYQDPGAVKTDLLRLSLCGSPENSNATENPDISVSAECSVPQGFTNLNYTLLLAWENVDLIPKAEAFECPVCFDSVSSQQGVVLRDCLHFFCRNCLAQTVVHCQDAVVKCPFRNEDYSCDSHLLEREIGALVSGELFGMQYNKRSRFFLCKSAGCFGWSLLADGDDVFECPMCEKVNCLICEVIHQGISCSQYQDDVEHSRSEEPGRSVSRDKVFLSYDHLVALELVDLIPNGETFECPVCFCTIEPQEGVVLRDCLHFFCRDCLAQSVEHCEEAVVKCPFQDGNYSCESYLLEREIKELVSPEMFTKYLQRSIKVAENQAKNSYHCKSADCPGWCMFDQQATLFPCPACGKDNCLTCDVIHEGMSCQQYKDKLKEEADKKEANVVAQKTQEYLDSLVADGEVMPCPTCKVLVKKISGCDWIRCTLCKTELCWATRGPRWGPKGNGDTSGGCRCMAAPQNVRCHPQCMNCH